MALSEIGFDIAVTMTDGNEVNVKCFKDLCQGEMKLWIDNPFNQSTSEVSPQKMFLAFDPPHLHTLFLFYKQLDSGPSPRSCLTFGDFRAQSCLTVA